MTPIAHAVRFALRCGIDSVAELASELECTPSAVYRAIKQLRENDHTVTLNDGTVKSQVTTRSVSDEAVKDNDRTETGIEVATRAPKELPNGNSYSSPAAAGGVGEIEGLNGSTSQCVDQLACMLAGPMGFPNYPSAKAVLKAQVENYGPQKVRIALADLQTMIASGERVTNPLKAFMGFVKNARSMPIENDREADRNAVDAMIASLQVEGTA